MNFPKKVISQVADDFSAKRQERESLRLKRLNEVYSLCPEIKEIDTELATVGSQIARATLMGKEGIKERIDAIKIKNLALQKKRGELLEGLGFEPSYTEPPYECEICQDTGYDGAKLCSCYRSALVTKAIESTGFGNLIKSQSFESFDLSVFEAEDAKERANYIYSILYRFADNFKLPCGNILLVGGTGLGKTHLSSAVARKVIEKGYNVVYESAESIFTEMAKERYNDTFSSEPEYFRFYTCDLLIIDDLGSEFITGFSTSCLYNIINMRLNKGLPVIISTNLSSDEIRSKYDERIASRIFGDFTILLIKGKDQRRKKLSKKI